MVGARGMGKFRGRPTFVLTCRYIPEWSGYYVTWSTGWSGPGLRLAGPTIPVVFPCAAGDQIPGRGSRDTAHRANLPFPQLGQSARGSVWGEIKRRFMNSKDNSIYRSRRPSPLPATGLVDVLNIFTASSRLRRLPADVWRGCQNDCETDLDGRQDVCVKGPHTWAAGTGWSPGVHQWLERLRYVRSPVTQRSLITTQESSALATLALTPTAVRCGELICAREYRSENRLNIRGVWVTG